MPWPRFKGLSPERAEGARKLAGVVRQFTADARKAYGAMIENPAAMNPKKLKELADRTAAVTAALEAAKVSFSGDLRAQLRALEDRSAEQRQLALVVFGVTLILAAGIVSLTIRKAITGPIIRVIEGVQKAASAAAGASERVAASGQSVADDAQNRAACIERRRLRSSRFRPPRGKMPTGHGPRIL
jgi:hypothetical protein